MEKGGQISRDKPDQVVFRLDSTLKIRSPPLGEITYIENLHQRLQLLRGCYSGMCY